MCRFGFDIGALSKRTIKHHGKSRPDLPEGCPEQFSWEFMQFMWRTRNSSRNSMARLCKNAPDDKLIYQLINLHEVNQFIEQQKILFLN